MRGWFVVGLVWAVGCFGEPAAGDDGGPGDGSAGTATSSVGSTSSASSGVTSGVDSSSDGGPMSTTAGDGSSGDTGEGITISGSVRDGALGLGNPAESVEVRVLMPGPMPPMTTTDASGEFVLDNVPPNQVVFIALAPTPGLALGAIHGIEVTDADVTGLALFRFPQADSTMLEDQLPVEFTLGTGALVGYADTPPVEFVFKPMPPTDSYFAYGMDDSPLINQTVSASTPPAASSFNLDPMPMPGMRTVEAEHVAGGTCTPLTPIAPPILAEHISYVQFDCP